MNKIIHALVVLACAVSTPILAQLSINKGVKAGLNVSNLCSNDFEGSISTKNGFLAGAYLELDLLGPIDIQGEALFTQKGAKIKESYEGMTSEATFSVSYIEIPILAKLAVPLAPPLVSSSFYAGPALAFKVSDTAKLEIDGKEQTLDDMFKPKYKSSDIGAVIGATMSFSALGMASIFLDLRYTLGLLNIADEENVTAKNGVTSLSVGMGF